MLKLILAKVYYNGVLDCFSKIAKQEGLWAVYKGIIPPILAETPKRATKFVCFEQYKTVLQKALGFEKATPFVSELAHDFFSRIEQRLICWFVQRFTHWQDSGLVSQKVSW